MLVKIKFLLCFLVISAIFLFSPRVVFATIEFTISNAVVANDEIDVNVNISGLTSSSCFENRCYLQGALKAENGTKYFGFTQNNDGEWFDYISSPEVEYIRSTFFYFEPEEGSWSGKLKLKNNPEDANYKGPGSYILKLRRYSGKSKSYAGESNTLTVNLVSFTPSPTPEPTNTPTPKPPTPTPTPKPPASTPTPSPSSTPTPTPSPSLRAVGLTATLSGEVLGEEEASPEAFYPWEATQEGDVAQEATPSKRRILPFVFLGLGLTFLGAAAYWLWYTTKLRWPEQEGS